MWKAYLIETMSGLVGQEVEMSTNGRLEITLNEIEQATITVQKSSLAGVSARWLRPWAQGFLVTLSTWYGDERPVFAGPIKGPPADHPDSLSFTVAGIREIFKYRILLAEDFSSSQINELRKSRVDYKDKSLAFIAQDIVRKGMAKAGGYLPIYFATDPGTGNHQRTDYLGYDVANNDIDKRLTELSNVIGGPDIMFYPEWADNSRSHIRWAMRTGTEAYPPIAQSSTMVLDVNARGTSVSAVELATSGDHYGTRAYTTGTGEGQGLLIRIHDQQSLLADGHPLLEVVESYQSVSRGETLSDYARTHTLIRPSVELQVTIDATDPSSAYGQWLVGHEAVVKPGDWFSIPNVEKPLRILRASADFDSPHMTLYFQEELAW